MTTTKYKAKPLYLDISTNTIKETNEVKQLSLEVKENFIYFASKHEYNVYVLLQQLSGNYTLSLQPKISVIPENKITCYPKGKDWKADFMMLKNGKPEMLVEAKGAITKDFMLTLALLELNDKNLFDKLWLIFPKQLPQNLIIKRLLTTPMKNRILTLIQFQRYLKKISS